MKCGNIVKKQKLYLRSKRPKKDTGKAKTTVRHSQENENTEIGGVHTIREESDEPVYKEIIEEKGYYNKYMKTKEVNR